MIKYLCKDFEVFHCKIFCGWNSKILVVFFNISVLISQIFVVNWWRFIFFTLILGLINATLYGTDLQECICYQMFNFEVLSGSFFFTYFFHSYSIYKYTVVSRIQLYENFWSSLSIVDFSQMSNVAWTLVQWLHCKTY